MQKTAKNPLIQQILVSSILLFGFTYLYFSTRTEVHTFDALSYTQDVESKPLIELFHPHHLLYGPAGRLAVNTAELFGYSGRADAPIQFLNALAGALGLILLWQFGIRLTGKRWLALSPALVMGFCYAYWLYAAEVEVYTFAAVFILLSLWILSDFVEHPTPRNAVFLGLASVGAVMFHQTNILFAIPVSIFLLMRMRPLMLPYGVIVTAGVGIPYLVIGWLSGFRSPRAYYDWLTDYAQQGTWGGYLSLDHLSALRDGLSHAVSTNGTLATVFFALVIVSGGIRIWRRTPSREWRVFAGVWLVLYGGFFWWWEPWNIEFWISLLPLWGMVMMWSLSPDANHEPPSRYTDYSQILFSGAALVLAVLLFRAHNAPIRESGDPQNDYDRQILEALEPFLAPTDFVVTHGNILDLYLPFYVDFPSSQIISLRALHFSNMHPGETLALQLEHAYHRGQIIYVERIVLDETRDPQRNPFGLTETDITNLRSQFPITETVSYDGQTVFYSIGERAAPDTLEWSFTEQLHGWLEFGAANLRFENGGWCITGGGDPWLESPPLRIDAAEHTTLEIDLYAADASAEYGQLFWRRENDTNLDEARSLRFSLEPGRHTYTVDLAENQTWQGTITFLRFDPIPENLETDACVFSLKFKE